MSASIYNFGSINIDHIYRVPEFVQPGETLSSVSLETVLGGKGANQSVAIARAGGIVKHIGCASKGDKWVFSYLESCGVDITHVRQVAAPTGHAIIQVNAAGENAIVLHGGANQLFQVEFLESVLSNAKKGDYLLVQNECNALSDILSLGLNRGMKVVLNPAPMTESIRALPLNKLDTIILNRVEASQLCEENQTSIIVDKLMGLYPDTRVILTLGNEGAWLISSAGVEKVPATAATVVDTTAAGDTFVGYFLAGLVDGLSDVDSLSRACSAAALTVQKLGAIPSIPTIDELNVQFKQ